MGRAFVKRCFIGAVAGVAANYLAAIAISCALRLGYFMPCLASLPERVGGEMNAVLLQLALCALLGAGVAAGWYVLRRKGNVRRRLLLTAATLVGFLTPAVALAVGMLK